MARRHTYPDRLSDAALKRTVEAFKQAPSQAEAARRLGISRMTLGSRLARAAQRGMIDASALPGIAKCQARTLTRLGAADFGSVVDEIGPDSRMEIPRLPDPVAPTDELIARRKNEYQRVDAARRARVLIPVKIKVDGPIGILHMGDPHVDDPGTDIAAIERHIAIINGTEGMFGANVGDLQNNWIGRLARLYGEQATSAAESWRLTEWLVSAVQWLYLIGGNHDNWSGAGDPLQWMMRSQPGVFEGWGARLNLTFPNGRQLRVNARHDFAGHSMWNTAHGAAKAVQMGWRDHILTCGHKHTSGYQVLKDPASGLISHVLRVAGYKIHDRYATELGLPNQNISPAVVTIIDPRWPDDDPRLVTVLHDPETAADFLAFLRRKDAA